MKIKRVCIDDIDFSDQRYRISYFFSADRLVQSIKEVGLIYPPVVVDGGKSLIPVTGWKRLMVCRKLALAPLSVFVCNQKNDLINFRLALFENWAARDFDLVEKSEILSKLKKFMVKDEEVIRDYLPLLKVPPTFDYFVLFRKISKLSRKEKKNIFDGNMALPVVEQLVRFSPEERRLLFPFLLCLSQNKGKELLGNAKEVSLKKKIPVKVILASNRYKAVLDSTKLSLFQKAEKIRQLLKEDRFPQLSARQKAFESAKKNLSWPRDMDISATPYFEDDEIHVQFSFKNEENFFKKLSLLRKTAESEDLARLLKTVSDE
jgi:ParB family chromosome partitioning protein